MKSAGVSGILKMTVIFFSLFLAGGAAFWSLYTDPSIFASLPFSPWFDPLGNGGVNALEKFLSLLVGIICTQTYIQAIFSASDPKTAAYGAFAAALVAIPVGLPCSMIGVYMPVSYTHLKKRSFGLPITRPGKTSSSYRRWRTGMAWWPGQPAPVKRSP